MPIEVKFKNPSNTLTRVILNYIYNFHLYIMNSSSDKKYTYAEIQKLLFEEIGSPKSSTRGWMPVVDRSGLLSYRTYKKTEEGFYTYHNSSDTYQLKNIIAPLGVVYLLILEILTIMYSKGSSNNTMVDFPPFMDVDKMDTLINEENEDLIRTIQSIIYDLNTLCFINRKKHLLKPEEEDCYPCLDYLKFCKKYDRINKYEFLYMTYTKNQNVTEYIESIENEIEKYRTTSEKLDFTETGFSYIQKFLLECNLIIPDTEHSGYYKLNKNRMNIINYLIEE